MNVAFDFSPEMRPGGALYCPGKGGDVGTEKDTERSAGAIAAAGLTTGVGQGKEQGKGPPARVHRDDSARVTEEMR